MLGRKTLIITVSLLVLAGLFLTACAVLTPVETIATATSPPTEIAATATPPPTGTPTTAPTEAPVEEHLIYTNTDYGFSFRYPPTWMLEEVPGWEDPRGKFAPSVMLRQQTLTLVIGYKRATEDVIIESGAAAGDFETRGSVTFLGQEVPRVVLVFEGKDKAVYYKGAGAEIQAGNLGFGISLHDLGADYGAIDILEVVQVEVDRIVESFELRAQAQRDFQPLSPVACNDLADATAQTLGIEVATAEAPFKDYVSGKEGTGCQATAKGTGLDFESLGGIESALISMLKAQGWHEEVQYAAGGPTGDVFGFRKDKELCLLDIHWEPSADASCPSDQPISACELTPEQRVYNIALNCVREIS